MTDILNLNDVSRETFTLLKEYEALIKEWNAKFNLVSKSSIDDIWNRHMADSFQLCQFILPSDKVLYDFGAGAGFPGIVIAVAAKQFFPQLSVNLVESIRKKANFLNTVKETLNLNITVINDRIENIKNKKADIITSRALASLAKLLEYSMPFCTKKTRLIFPKGAKWQEELDKAKKQWIFDCNIIDSQTDETGHILIIYNLRRRKW